MLSYQFTTIPCHSIICDTFCTFPPFNHPLTISHWFLFFHRSAVHYLQSKCLIDLSNITSILLPQAIRFATHYCNTTLATTLLQHYPLKHIRSTHNLTTHRINPRSQHILFTHALVTPYQYIINLVHPLLSYHLVVVLSSITLPLPLSLFSGTSQLHEKRLERCERTSQ